MTSFTHYMSFETSARQRVAVKPIDGMTVGCLIAKDTAAGGGITG